MTEREKQTITLVSHYGALSKKELAEREGISWATAVKLVSNLESDGIPTCVGSESQLEKHDPAPCGPSSDQKPDAFPITGLFHHDLFRFCATILNRQGCAGRH